jgi:hypothetical protein
MLLVRAAPARLAPQPQTSEELRLLVINNFGVPSHVCSHYYHSPVSWRGYESMRSGHRLKIVHFLLRVLPSLI